MQCIDLRKNNAFRKGKRKLAKKTKLTLIRQNAEAALRTWRENERMKAGPRLVKP